MSIMERMKLMKKMKVMTKVGFKVGQLMTGAEQDECLQQSHEEMKVQFFQSQ